MKKIIATTLLCLSFMVAFSQTESENSKWVFAKFKVYYNSDQPDSIFAMFSPDTKINLPLTKTTAFLVQLKYRFGNITSATFISYNSLFAVYKTEFEKGTIALQISVDDSRAITGLFAKPYELETESAAKNNITPMQLPFKGEWTVFWGGDTKQLNQHIGVKFQRNAFDIIITNQENKSFRTDGKTNEDYYAFGQRIMAPCSGKVVLVVDGVKDNIPGAVNTLYIPGNTIILKTANNEYVFMAHFKEHSIQVKQGDMVKQGQVLGLCGNSGNSSEPHLHFHIQDMENPLQASGIKCNFNKITVGGMLKMNYSPIKGDRVSNP